MPLLTPDHPLSGSWERIARADSHIRQMKRRARALERLIEDKAVAYHQTSSLQLLLKPGERIARSYNQIFPTTPPIFPIIAGEVIYNLRSALDYLMYELCGHRSGTQFPIEDIKRSKDGKHGFDARMDEMKVPASARGPLEALQPYAGCAWTKTLREISNPDKHRRLTVLYGKWSARHTIEVQHSGAFLDRPGKVFKAASHADADVHVDCEGSIEIQFPDGRAVLETLEILKRHVSQTILSFEPEFK